MEKLIFISLVIIMSMSLSHSQGFNVNQTAQLCQHDQLEGVIQFSENVSYLVTKQDNGSFLYWPWNDKQVMAGMTYDKAFLVDGVPSAILSQLIFVCNYESTFSHQLDFWTGFKLNGHLYINMSTGNVEFKNDKGTLNFNSLTSYDKTIRHDCMTLLQNNWLTTLNGQFSVANVSNNKETTLMTNPKVNAVFKHQNNYYAVDANKKTIFKLDCQGDWNNPKSLKSCKAINPKPVKQFPFCEGWFIEALPYSLTAEASEGDNMPWITLGIAAIIVIGIIVAAGVYFMRKKKTGEFELSLTASRSSKSSKTSKSKRSSKKSKSTTNSKSSKSEA